MYTAHHDHLGFASGVSGDNIYNGAADNATGCGMLLELARAWAASGLKPPHSVIFAAVAAEEQGLAGQRIPGPAPTTIPDAQITLDINYDMILPIGIPRQVNVNGAQRTTFYPNVEATAKRLTSPSSPTLTPAREATTAPTTSRSHGLATPPSPLNRASSSKATTKPGDRGKPRTLSIAITTTSPTTITPTGTSPATPSSFASAWTWAGRL